MLDNFPPDYDFDTQGGSRQPMRYRRLPRQRPLGLMIIAIYHLFGAVLSAPNR